MNVTSENKWNAFADDAGRWVDEAGEKLAELATAHGLTDPKGQPVTRHYLESLLEAVAGNFEAQCFQLAPGVPDQLDVEPATDFLSLSEFLEHIGRGDQRGAALQSGLARLAAAVNRYRAARENADSEPVDVLVDADITAQAAVDMAMLRDPGVRPSHAANAATTAHLVGDPELSAFFDGVAVAMAAGSR